MITDRGCGLAELGRPFTILNVALSHRTTSDLGWTKVSYPTPHDNFIPSIVIATTDDFLATAMQQDRLQKVSQHSSYLLRGTYMLKLCYHGPFPVHERRILLNNPSIDEMSHL